MKTHAPARQSITPSRSAGSSHAAFFKAPSTTAPAFFATASGPLQTSLTVSQPGDPHEIEAEKMADHVVSRQSEPFFTPTSGVQRQAEPTVDDEVDRATEKEDDGREREEIPAAVHRSALAKSPATSRHVRAWRGGRVRTAPRPRSNAPTISRVALPARSGGRAARIDPSRARGPPAVSPKFESQLRASKGGGQALAPGTREKMESSFGADFSGVRIHAGNEADQMSRGIQARAFTHGQDIYFARNRYQPGDQEGRHLLAHELTHVIQQGGGIRENRPVRRSPDLSRAPPSLQRIPTSMEELRGEVNSLAENIPGYALGTVLIGYNPILGQNVAWSASAFFRGAAGLIPGGTAVYDKLNEGGAIDEAFAWIEGEISSRNLTWGRVSGLWDEAWEKMGVTEGISGNVAIFENTFSGFFADVLGFIGAVVDKLTAILKDLAIAAVRALFGSDGPAYDMITMVLGEDPLTGEAKTWETVEFLRAALNFFGFGNHVAKMDETGQLQNAADWLDQQFGILSSALSGLISGITDIWDSLGLETLANPLDVLTRTVGVVTGFVGALLEFVGNLASKILELIKEVVIALARAYAYQIPGYRLFTVIIGLDPISGEDVPRTAMNFVRGFLDFVPNGDEIYKNLEEGNAIGKAMDWLGEQAAELGLTPGAIVARFTELWTSFSIDDLMDPIGAFERVAGVFLGFIADVLTLAGRIALKLLEILFEVVMGGGGAQVLAILKQAQGAFNTIVEDPVAFVGNLVAAAKLGFTQFAGNILEHLKTGLLGWLFGALEGAGIQLPATFDLQGMLSLALQVLGLTYQQIRPQLVQHLGEPLVGHLETAFEVVRILLTEGLAGIWSRITEFLTVSLPEMVIGAIKNFVMEKIVVAAVTRIASMLNPAGAVVQAIIAIYNTVMFFIERMNQIMATVEAFVGSVSKIAAGDIGSAANAVEQTMARTLPVIISFLARLLGLGGISDKIREIIQRIQAPIQAAIGRVIGWIVAQARRLGRGVLQAGTGDMTPQEKFNRGMELAVGAVNRFRGRPVGEAVLTPLLSGIATRYDFQYLRVLPRDGHWVVSGKVNPEGDQATEAQTEAAGNPEQVLGQVQQAMAQETGSGVAAAEVPAVVQRAKRRLVVAGVQDMQAQTAASGAITVSFRTDAAYFPAGTLAATMGAAPPGRTVRSETRIQLVSNQPIANLSSLLPTDLPAGGVNPTQSTGGRTEVAGNEIRLMTWNTSPMSQTGGSHSEAHIPEAFRGGAEEALKYVETIVVRNFSYSACSSCASGLAGFLGQVCAAQRTAGTVVLRQAEIFWTTRYGDTERFQRPDATTWSSIQSMAAAGWTIHAPASALPDPSGGRPNQVEEAAARRPLSQQVVVIAGTLQCKPLTPGTEDEAEREANAVAAGRTSRRPMARPSIDWREVPLSRRGGPGKPLDKDTRSGFEDAFGCDFSRVRIHRDEQAAELGALLQARAVTHGPDIHWSPHDVSPTSPEGRELLAHELSHVIQQGAAPPLAGSAPSTRTHTAMKIRPTFRRSARRVSRRASEAPFFQNEAPEAAFFTPASDAKAKKPDEEPVKVAKKPEEEPAIAKKPEDEVQAKKPEEEIAAKQEDEEVQAKQEDEEPVMAKCGCGCGGGGNCRSAEPPEGARAKRPAAKSDLEASRAKDEPCSGGELAVIAMARARAKRLADRAVAQLTALMLMEDVAGAPPAALAIYERWFGGFDDGRVRFVRNRFLKIAEALAGTVEFECDCDRAIYAFASPGGKRKITLCKLFWSAGFSGLDSKAGVILHELAHDVCFALDLRYGAAKAEALAKTSPLLAMLNADNYEYFAESL